MHLLTANDAHLASDRPFDFTMREYRWRQAPRTDALSAASLLGVSFATVAGAHGLHRAVNRFRRSFGRCRTTWAAVDRAGKLSWEFYWYNGHRLPAVDVAQSLDLLGVGVIEPWLADIPPKPDVFSIDVDLALLEGERRIDAINLYIGNPASRVPAGYCYRWTADGPLLSNSYHKFPRSIIEAARTQLSTSLHLDDIDRLLWEDVLPCDSLHVANKARCDGIYYGGLDTRGLLKVLDRTESHDQIRAHLIEAEERLQHLSFDVGIDIQRGRADYAKVAVYGAL